MLTIEAGSHGFSVTIQRTGITGLFNEHHYFSTRAEAMEFVVEHFPGLPDAP